VTALEIASIAKFYPGNCSVSGVNFSIFFSIDQTEPVNGQLAWWRTNCSSIPTTETFVRRADSSDSSDSSDSLPSIRERDRMAATQAKWASLVCDDSLGWHGPAHSNVRPQIRVGREEGL
jgi:hypothetical protein